MDTPQQPDLDADRRETRNAVLIVLILPHVVALAGHLLLWLL